jgi:hypothetical protein
VIGGKASRRDAWKATYEQELPKLIERTPRSLALFLTNEDANYTKSLRRHILRFEDRES